MCCIVFSCSIDSTVLRFVFAFFCNRGCREGWSACCLTHNDSITQFLAIWCTRSELWADICFSRRICHRRKIVFAQRARSLFVLDSFTHHIPCGLVPRRSILPFMDGKISASFSTSFHFPTFYNGNCGCLSLGINVTFCNNESKDINVI